MRITRRFFLSGLAAGTTVFLEGCSGVQMPGSRSDESDVAGPAFGDGTKTPQAYIPAENRKPPTRAELMKPGPLWENSLGRADAKVTIIEYASHTCPYCRAFHARTFPKFRRAYIDTGKVYFILREFPIGHSSGTAAIVNKCAPKGKYFQLFHEFMARQGEWVSQEVRTDRIFRIGRLVGLTNAQMNACLKDEKLVAGLRAVKQRGREYGVAGTPTFFINGEKVRGVLTMADLRARIDPLLG